jgi:hypothetical protein
VSILSVVGIWIGGNIVLFGWLVWQRVVAPPRCSLAQSAVVGAPLNQTSVVILFAPLSLRPSSTNPRTFPKSISINA